MTATLKGMAGPELVRGYCKSKGLTYELVASVLEISPQTLAQWATGQTRPRLAMRLVLRELAGIDPDQWVASGEQEQADNLIQKIREWRDAPTVAEPSNRDKLAGRI